MATRDEFLRQVWTEIINSPLEESWIPNLIAHCKRRPQDPFGDTGPALERLIASGASPQDLSLVVRAAKYEAVFGYMYMLDDPGVEDGEGLFESILSADPSGMEGRPGSTSIKKP